MWLSMRDRPRATAPLITVAFWPVLADPFQGVLRAGLPFRSERWNEFTARRDAGLVVRFMNQDGVLGTPTASRAAVRDGRSIDTRMGVTPTRCHHMVNHESGQPGVSETTHDMRDLPAQESADVRAAEWTRSSSQAVSANLHRRCARVSATGRASSGSNCTRRAMRRRRARVGHRR